MTRNQQNRLARTWPDRMRFDVPMAEHSTLRAGGRAAALLTVQTLEELRRLLAQLDTEKIPFLIIGCGSNILVADSGYPGVIIRLKGEFNTIAMQERNPEAVIVKTGAGCPLGKLVSWCSSNGLSGLEFMSGIPGSAGGAVQMNAGAWGKEIGPQLLELETVTQQGKVQRFAKEELRLSYRNLAFAHHETERLIITSATFSLLPDREEEIRARCRGYLEQRRGKQPAGVASAGSFFKNPPGDSAGRLIEAAGLKGRCCGQAMVSPVHANFIVNTGQATATEIILLMEQIQEAVLQQFSIRLEPEVRIFRTVPDSLRTG